MYRCLLVPLDGTAFGEHALPYAVAIARRSGAVLHLTHVHLPPIMPSGAETAALPPAWIDMTREEKRSYLDALSARLTSGHGIRVETRVMEGGVASAIEHQAMSCAAGLIVMSTHAHVGLSRLWHNGVADQLARELPLPVLLVRPGGLTPSPDFAEEPGIRHVLVPLDGSAEAEGVLGHAMRLGRTFRARYTLLRVLQPESLTGYSLLARDAQLSGEQLQAEQSAALHYLNTLAERMRLSGLEVATEVVISQDVARAVVDRIRSVAESPDRRVDLVALEAHQRSVVTRLLFRGTADTLVMESPVPVLLFQFVPLAVAPLIAEAGLAGGG